MINHTKTPWVIDTNGNTILGNRNGYMSIVATVYSGHNASQADVRLIAAAPDLLAALTDIFEQCALMHKHWGDGDNTRKADAAIAAGRAAIAKATHQESTANA